MALLKGGLEIATFLGLTQRATVSHWRKRYDDLPVSVDKDGGLIADPAALRAWALKHGKLQPSTVDEFQAVNAGREQIEIPAVPQLDDDRGAVGGDLDAWLDMGVWRDYPEPTGDIEDELREARRLRHLFGRLVFSWRKETLGDPKTAKSFQDFASGLTRQIAVIGRLEESLTKQRMRLGQLLDAESIVQTAERLAARSEAVWRDFMRDAFGIMVGEVQAAAAALGVDLALNSDKVLKLLDRRFVDAARAAAELGPVVVDESQREQAERLRGEEED